MHYRNGREAKNGMTDASCEDCIFRKRSARNYPCYECWTYNKFVPNNPNDSGTVINKLLTEIDSLKKTIDKLEDEIKEFDRNIRKVLKR
jgi:hypothetical protein